MGYPAVAVLREFATKPLRLPRFGTYVPGPDDPKIFWFNSAREDLIDEVVRRVIERHGEADEDLELVLNDAAYQEIRRLEGQGNGEAKRNLDDWRGLIRRIGRMSPEGMVDSLRTLVRVMAQDVAGNFDPRVYRFAARTLPNILTAVMNPSGLLRNALAPEVPRLDDLVASEGPVEHVRMLARIGTVVLVPTHVSNLDSLAVGWVLCRDGLPPVVYGAGKNLFTNPIISFFMHNLGAYRVDRRIKASIYKEVLKTYSCLLLERGYHSLFFPGGTRSRSGTIETQLKLGLAGAAVEAYSRNVTRGLRRPMFFVPATINYDLVLEAETLIDDHLKDRGKARYIIEDDEFSRIDRWVAFFRRLRGLEAACVIRFGQALDPFCNPVDEQGRSQAPNGRLIDPATYVERNGVPVVDHERDAAYTRELGHALAAQYVRDTVVMPTQLVAHVLFRRIVQVLPDIDLFARLRHRGEVAIPRDELVREIGEARDRLLALEIAGRVHLNGALRREAPSVTLERALHVWNGYHTRTVARELAGSIVAEDPVLLLYYANRLRPFALELADDESRAAAREIAVMEHDE